jgi:site-specific DNA recombinase
MGTTTTAAHPGMTSGPGQPVPVAFLGRTSTLALQNPALSLRRQLHEVQAKLPAGWFIAAHYWDIESGGLDLDQRGHGTAHQQVDVGIPRDGGLAALLAEADSPAPRFAVVMCEDIERSGRDVYAALKLEKRLSAAGIPLLATDEPIDIAGMNATTVLVRRIKQGIAEWYRLQLKDKIWKGLREHSADGWNIGTPPYGYTADRVPHPVPAKAAIGATKTRLALDPARAPIVAAIFAWRTCDRLGLRAIAARLNADPGKYPPPRPGGWTPTGVASILRNPKYTGYMVYGRSRKVGASRGLRVPPAEWIWSPQPAHPAIISRATWDAAQAAGAEHATSRDDPGPNTHPATRRAYVLRGRIRHRECKRRMIGKAKTFASGQPGLTYYGCPHDPDNPRHAAACPDHPRTVRLREDHLLDVIRQFFAQRIFGPERAALLAAALPATDHDAAAQTQQRAEALNKQLRQIDAAENAHAREIEALAGLPAGSPAITALRTRLIHRFTELEDQRAAIQRQLSAVLAAPARGNDPALLDALPLLGDILTQAPAQLQQQLYQAFDLQVLYDSGKHQVSIHAVITPATPNTLAAIISDSEPPAQPAPGSLLVHAARRAVGSPLMGCPSHPAAVERRCAVVVRAGPVGFRPGWRATGRAGGLLAGLAGYWPGWRATGRAGG